MAETSQGGSTHGSGRFGFNTNLGRGNKSGICISLWDSDNASTLYVISVSRGNPRLIGNVLGNLGISPTIINIGKGFRSVKPRYISGFGSMKFPVIIGAKSLGAIPNNSVTRPCANVWTNAQVYSFFVTLCLFLQSTSG